jgi:hypothetical protein
MEDKLNEQSLDNEVKNEARHLDEIAEREGTLSSQHFMAAFRNLGEASVRQILPLSDAGVSVEVIASKAFQIFDKIYPASSFDLLQRFLSFALTSAINEIISSPKLEAREDQEIQESEEVEYLSKVPDDPAELFGWVAQRIYRRSQLELRLKPQAVRAELRRLNEILFPLYESREELEKQLEKYPEEKERLLSDFDEMIARISNPSAESIAKRSRQEREKHLSDFTEQIFENHIQNIRQIVCLAICADLSIAGYYGKYAWAKQQGIPESAARKELPAKSELTENVAKWLAKNLVEDFSARDGRGRKPKPAMALDEEHTSEWKEKVINTYIQAKVKTMANVAKTLGLGSTKALARKLKPLGLTFSKLKIEAQIRIQSETRN